MKRQASARWVKTLKQGGGELSTGSGVLRKTPYSFQSRFESGTETNPEELIAAAHAGCFSMALALQLEQAGSPPEFIETQATITLDEKVLAITEVQLECRANVPGIDLAQFREIAENAKTNCPVSKVLRATIGLNAQLLT